MIYLQGSAPPEKALLNQDFGANLVILLGLAALISLLGYATGTSCGLVRLRRPAAEPGPAAGSPRTTTTSAPP